MQIFSLLLMIQNDFIIYLDKIIFLKKSKINTL